MKNTKILIVFTLLLFAIGFAAITTDLFVTGNAKFGTSSDDFSVIFTNAYLDGEDISDKAIINDGKSIVYTTNNLEVVGDSSKLDYGVKNNSTQYDAVIEIVCVGGDNENFYYKITENTPASIAAQTTEKGDVIVTLTKTSVNEIEEEFTCTLTASATEREKTAEVVVEKKFELTKDENNNQIAEYGDMISIGDENFYVLTNDGTNIQMFAEYNIYVGSEFDNVAKILTPYTSPTGLQDSTMLGYTTTSTLFKGVVAFADDTTMGDKYNTYEGSLAEQYVNEYANKLSKDASGTVTGTLLGIEDIESILKVTSIEQGDNMSDFNAPTWMYNTSYWTRTAFTEYSNSTSIWNISSDGMILANGHSSDTSFGIRPVITIPVTLLN